MMWESGSIWIKPLEDESECRQMACGQYVIRVKKGCPDSLYDAASAETPEIKKAPGVEPRGLRSPTWTRTKNLSVNSRLLCQLSYGGMFRTLVRATSPY